MRKSAMFAAALALTVSGPADAAKPRCMSEAEADAVLITVLPDILEGAGRACAGALPATSILRQGLAPLIDGFRSEAVGLRPSALQGFAKMTGTILPAGQESVLLPMLSKTLSAEFAKSIAVRDCPVVEELVTAVAPLPVRNMSRLLRAIVQLDAGKKGGGPLPICPVKQP